MLGMLVIFALFLLTFSAVEASKLPTHKRKLVIAAVLIAACFVAKRLYKTPYHDSALSGKMYYAELMQTRNPHRFLDVMRMDRRAFRRLHRLLTKKGGLKSSVTCKPQVCSGEKIMMFIHLLKGWSVREIAERFQHSTSTVHNASHQVGRSLLEVKGALYAQPSATDDTAEQIRDNPKFWPYFKDCIGALDGTHIHCIPPVDAISAFRNRKKGISQNVLAVCNFDMLFEYCLYGWEGSAHDGKVLTDALDKGLPIILGKYWLGDAGYALRSYCLTPYRGVRYHLKEWASIGERPQTK